MIGLTNARNLVAIALVASLSATSRIGAQSIGAPKRVSTPAPQAEGANQLRNPSFDPGTNLNVFGGSWVLGGGSWEASTLEASSSSTPGSVLLTAPSSTQPMTLSQCVPNMPQSSSFEYGVSLYIPAGQTASAKVTLSLHSSTTNTCSSATQFAEITLPGPFVTGTWIRLDSAAMSLADTSAIRFRLTVDTEGSGEFSLNVDDALLSTEAPVLRIEGDTFITDGRPSTYRASATGCSPGPYNWRWTAESDPAIVGAVTEEATITWIDLNSRLVTVTNSDCGTATATFSPAGSKTALPSPLAISRHPSGLIRGARESTSFTILYSPVELLLPSPEPVPINFSAEPIDLEFSPASVSLRSGESATISVKFPDDVVASAGGHLLTTSAQIEYPDFGGIRRSREVPIHMLLAPPSATEPLIITQPRVDFSSDAGRYTATLQFTNAGTSRVEALMSPAVPWVDVTSDPLVTLEPGETRNATFDIVRGRRPDGDAPLGSTGSYIELLYPEATAKTGRMTASAAVVPLATTVTDTQPGPTATLPIPPLTEGEVALFLPGIGHIQGSVGLFITDISITNNDLLDDARNVLMYYLPAGSSQATETVHPRIATDTAVSLADVVKQTFKAEGQIGTLQLRPRKPDTISATATVFNSSNLAGTYGTAIPLFRSDRGARSGESIEITGLRKSDTSHTNIYLQEVAGAPATVNLDYFDEEGKTVGSGAETLAAFGLLQKSDAVPAGSASVVITVAPSASGRVVSFATPVDRLSGDTWAITDWRRFYDYAGDDASLVPVAGSIRGANRTYFRTDLAVMNTGLETAIVTLDYFGRAGERVTKVLSVAARESRLLDDVVAGFFGVPDDSVGAVVVRPTSGDEVLTTSRTYTILEGEPGTYGTGVPTLGLANAMQPGEIRRFGGLEDATLATISAARPASFRTNFGIVETAGASARVRATVKYPVQASIVSATATLVRASKEYTLAPNQLLLLNNVAREIIGEERDTALGDLPNLQVEFEMLEGRAHVFVTSTDNGTGDTVLRTE